MYCSNCGAQSAVTTCLVCGQDLSLLTHGVIDAISGLPLAGWWRRVGGTLSDTLILLFPTLVFIALFADANALWLGVVAGLLVRGTYEVSLLSSERGQTVGNRVVSTRVCDAHSAGRITVAQALRRFGVIAFYNVVALFGNLGFEIAIVLALADYLCLLVDRRNQTLHDKFARTIVVNL